MILAFHKTMLMTIYAALVQLFSVATSSANAPNGVTARLPHVVRPLGAAIVFIAILILFTGMSLLRVSHSRRAHSFSLGISRYFRVQALLIEGRFPPARHLILIISALLAVLVLIVFGILASATH